jgi:hypothetical protein
VTRRCCATPASRPSIRGCSTAAAAASSKSSASIASANLAAGAALLYAFGTLIGNTDMHHGNLSFVAEHGRPYQLAPAYDMLPMTFAPRRSGDLPSSLPPARLHPGVSAETWRQAQALADEFIVRLSGDGRFSGEWSPCAEALARHVDDARVKIGRLG